MKSTRRRSVTETFEVTTIVLRYGNGFRFCEDCCESRTNVSERDDLLRLSLEEILMSGKFQVTRVYQGTPIVCSREANT